MEIDYRLLQPETLRSLIEEFVTRDGTDYGNREAALDTKVDQVHQQLERGLIKLVYDPESESCNLLVEEPGKKKL